MNLKINWVRRQLLVWEWVNIKRHPTFPNVVGKKLNDTDQNIKKVKKICYVLKLLFDFLIEGFIIFCGVVVGFFFFGLWLLTLFSHLVISYVWIN